MAEEDPNQRVITNKEHRRDAREHLIEKNNSALTK
jgi:hypothetical protein